MSHRLPVLAAALSLTVAMLGQVEAAETSRSNSTPVSFVTPTVIDAAYQNRRIALNAAGVLRQGGFATAGAVQWLPAAPVTAEVDHLRLGAL